MWCDPRGTSKSVCGRAGEVLTVDGEHFTMPGKRADMVANVVDKWITVVFW
jgi:hypothetical protein